MIQAAVSFLSLFIGVTSVAHAHVGYVVGQTEFTQHLGGNPAYFFGAMTHAKNILLVFVTLIGVAIAYFLAWRIHHVRNWIISIRMRLDTYEEYVPWILRLSLGIAFIGASVAQVLVSPLLPHPGFVVIQLVVGFALLAGIAVVPAAITGLVLFISAVLQKTYILGNAEVATALIALLILGNARPGIDDIFGIPELRISALKPYIPFLLRIGVGGALTFLALYEKILNPYVLNLVIEKFGLNTAIPVGAQMWVFAVGMIELVVGLFLLLGFQTRLISAVAFLVLIVTFFFFREEVYSHVTLFGVISALFITGGGRWSLDYVLKPKRG